MVRGRPAMTGNIQRTAVMMVEGEEDDISAPGQTYAAHALCTGVPKEFRRHLLVSRSGHFPLFHGTRSVTAHQEAGHEAHGPRVLMRRLIAVSVPSVLVPALGFPPVPAQARVYTDMPCHSEEMPMGGEGSGAPPARCLAPCWAATLWTLPPDGGWIARGGACRRR
jgi:hypothetical protein